MPVWALKNGGGSGTVQVDLGATRRVLAWGQMTMVDSLADADQDNAWAIEVFDVDGDRPGGFVFGGEHWGSSEAPWTSSGAFAGRARRITFRASAIHTANLDALASATCSSSTSSGGSDGSHPVDDRETGELLHSHYEVRAVDDAATAGPGCRRREPLIPTPSWPSS